LAGPETIHLIIGFFFSDDELKFLGIESERGSNFGKHIELKEELIPRFLQAQ